MDGRPGPRDRRVEQAGLQVNGLILARWAGPYPAGVLDERGLHLRGRTLVLHGDMLRYQGHLFGPGSAQRSYDEAASLFRQFGSQRRLAQVDLAQAITLEMSGEVFGSARQYRALSEDERLRDYERAQARLWIGTALTKAGDIASAISEIDRAVRMFDEQGEPDDWAVAHQKRALASLAAGDIANATRAIEIATSYRRHDSPLEQVRLDTAHGHILTSDARSRDEGLAILQRARETATRYGLAHQLQWIDRIERGAYETPARRVR